MSQADEEKQAQEAKALINRARELDLAEAKRRFRELVKQEANDVRKTVLQNFEVRVESMKTAKEVAGLQAEALEAACAEVKALEASQSEVAAERADQRKAAQKLITIWAVGAALILITTLTGFKQVYYYKAPDGTVVKADDYEGKYYVTGREKIKVEYNHEGYGFNRQPAARAVVIVSILLVCMLMTFATSTDKEPA